MRQIVLALLLCVPMFAQHAPLPDIAKSGNDFLLACEKSSHGTIDENALQCITWLEGVLDGFHAYKAVSDVPLYDLPPDVTVGQIEKIVIKYMNDNPRWLDVSTSWIVLGALKENFPPERKKK